MEYDTNLEYRQLVKKWAEYKELEQLANAGRIKTEKAILSIVGKDLNEKGVNNLPLGLKITTGIAQAWDMDGVSRQKAKFDDGLLDLPYFPFVQQWKPDTKKLAFLNESNPATFNDVFSNALTIKPKKPSFSIKIKE